MAKRLSASFPQDCTRVGSTHFLYYMRVLVCRYIEYFLQLHNPKPFPSSEFPSVTALSEAVLRRFSRTRLLRTHEPSVFSKPEFKFYEEWYIAFNSLVGRGVSISSEWSFAGEGRIDFRIKEPGWGGRDNSRWRQA